MTKVVWIKRSIEDVGSEAPVIWSARNQRHVKGEAEERKKKMTRGETAGDICRRTPELKEATPRLFVDRQGQERIAETMNGFP